MFDSLEIGASAGYNLIYAYRKCGETYMLAGINGLWGGGRLQKILFVEETTMSQTVFGLRFFD